jgi:excinuclease ABC subunit C
MLTIEDIKQLELPKTPGSYQYYDQEGKILYVGKAVDLRSRVLSYWQKGAGHTPAKAAMMKLIAEVRWITVDSEIEALLLESNLIKRFQPPFNVDLRDDKRHTYIKISGEEVPRIHSTRQLSNTGTFFGPFVSAGAVRETLRAIRRIWPYRSCATLPRKACLYQRLGKCPGMCEFPETREAYRHSAKQIGLFLAGKKKSIVNGIEKELKRLERKESKEGLSDEEARQLATSRYELMNIEHVLKHTEIINLVDKYAADVVELAKVLSLPRVPERIEGYDISNIFGRDAVGSMVVFNGGEPDKDEYRKFKIKLSEGQAGDTFMLQEMLTRRLLHSLPEKEESKAGAQESNIEKWPTPDLIIIDGGKGQLNVVLRILKRLKLDIPAIAVSKGEGLRSAQAPDKIFFPGEKEALKLPLASPALHIIKRVRDEAHRFAIKYHRELRGKRLFRK